MTATMPVTQPVNVTFAARMIEKEFLLRENQPISQLTSAAT